MGFQKGVPRPANAGRKKGSKNKLSLAALQRLAELKVDPLKEISKIARDPTTPIEIRAKCWIELSAYVYPKRKAVEHSGIIENVNVDNTDAIESLRDRIARLAAESGSGSVLPDPKPN